MALTGIDRTGHVGSVLLDKDTQGLYVIETTHAFIHDGRSWEWHYNVSAASGASGTFIIRPTAGKYVHLNSIELDVTGATSLLIWEYQSSGNGSGNISSSGNSASATPLNRNRQSNASDTSPITIYTGSGLVTTSATELDHWQVGASGSAFRIGGVVASEVEWVLKDNTPYALNWFSNSADNRINLRLLFSDYSDR